MSLSRDSRSSSVTGFLLTVIAASSSASTTWLGGVFCSGWLGGGGCGSEMSSPRCASGVTTMKMMSSTSITSMSGVMLMSAIAPLSACTSSVLPRRRFFSISLWCWTSLSTGFCGWAMTLPLHLALGDQRHFLGPRLAHQVHHLHHLGVGQRVVGLQVDHARALGQVLDLLLDLGQELGLVVELLAAQVGGRVLLDRDHDRLGLVLALLGVARLGQHHVDALLQQRRDHHEDDQEHDHDVGHGRDVDVRHRSALASADCHCHGMAPSSASATGPLEGPAV